MLLHARRMNASRTNAVETKRNLSPFSPSIFLATRGKLSRSLVRRELPVEDVRSFNLLVFFPFFFLFYLHDDPSRRPSPRSISRTATKRPFFFRFPCDQRHDRSVPPFSALLYLEHLVSFDIAEDSPRNIFPPLSLSFPASRPSSFAR